MDKANAAPAEEIFFEKADLNSIDRLYTWLSADDDVELVRDFLHPLDPSDLEYGELRRLLFEKNAQH